MWNFIEVWNHFARVYGLIELIEEKYKEKIVL